MTPINFESTLYDVSRFVEGGCSLHRLDVEGMGEVAGQDLLHLQCHFGQDTLSWARRGANVTGIDFSASALRKARELSVLCGLGGTFLESDIYAAKEQFPEQAGRFSRVFTSAGVLTWLPDVRAWAETVAYFLAPGGRFFMREFHPFAWMCDTTRGREEFVLQHSYFCEGAGTVFEDEGCYAEPGLRVRLRTIEWNHALSTVLQALIDAGLRLDHVAEYPFLSYQAFPWLVQDAAGDWYPRDGIAKGPLMYTVGASKENGGGKA